MVGFKVETFAGAQPIRDPRLLPEVNAQIAVNQRVESGALDPLATPRLLKALQASTKCVYRIPNGALSDLSASTWIEFADADTDMVRTPVVNDSFKRYYWASPTEHFKYAPEATLLSGGSGAGLVTGVPRPATAVTLDVIAGSGTTPPAGTLQVTRSYVVTFVSVYGEEGAPSPAAEATGYDTQDWRLRDIPQPSIEAGRTSYQYIRIYRTETAASGATVFNKVVDIAVGQLIYVDRIPSIVVNGQPQLDAENNDQPPEMDGLALMPNGVLVGFKGNNLFFSENYQPHSWPAAYTLAVQHPIVGLAVFGTTCVVCTQGNPVAVTGTGGAVMTLTQSDVAMPCVSRRSIVVAPEGVYFATTNGLVLYGPSGPTIVSDELIGRKLWENRFNPASTDAVLYQGGYLGMRVVDAAYRAFNFVSSSVVEVEVQASIATPCFVGMDLWSNKPWLIQGGNLYDWLPNDTPLRTLQWKSKEFRLPNRAAMAAAQVYADGPVRVLIYAGTRLISDKTISNSNPYRLPSGYKTDLWSIEFRGNTRVRLGLVASSIEDLKKQ